MRSKMIVGGEVSRQAGGTGGGVVERLGVGPLGQQGADEALRFAVGLGPVGARLAQADPQPRSGGHEQLRAIAATVVGEDALDGDALTGIEGHRPLQEGGGGGRCLVGQLLDVGQAAEVVDRHMDPVPADAAMAVDLTAPAKHAVPAAGTNATQLLGIEVQQLAGPGALVTDHRRPRLEAVQASQSMALEDGVDRGAGEAGLPAQAVRPDPQLAAQPAQLLDGHLVMSTRLVLHRAAPIDEADGSRAPVAVPPLRAGLAADACRPRRGTDRPATSNALHQDQPTTRCEPRVSMRHEGPSFDCGLLTSSRRIRALTRQQPDWELELADLDGRASLRELLL